MKKKLSLVLIIVLIFASFYLGFFLGQSEKICPICQPAGIDFSLFWQTWNKIHQDYVDSSKLNTQKMIYGAIKGMVNSLDDPYTVFFDPSDAKTFLEDVNGSFGGVGIEIGVRDGKFKVISPLEGTPAKKAGIMPGDEIVGVNGKSVEGIGIDELVKLIRGPKGTKVTLTIKRKGWSSPREFKIKRAIINVPSLKWYLISSKTGKEDKNGDIAYINLYQFSREADPVFKEVANKILRSSAKKIILDLRNNPGGYLDVAQDIAGLFLKRGKVVVIEDFGGKRKREIYKSRGNAKLSKYPVVILINKGTASAAEILSAALRDNRGIKLIGETSFGKGCVQELENLRGGSSLKITVANWLTPKGDQISHKGLKPDIEVKMSEEDYDKGIDPQLEKAIEIIKNMK